ncbi:site-specific DNA-methyltransferase [Janibacter terrae]|nr:site-specific DNA-methyltransferase [Janibacter terrae]
MPPRRKKPTGPVPIESVQHQDKRTNLPTADAQDLVTPEIEQARRIVCGRDATLDPQLVWKGKFPGDDPANAIDLVADAPPIYVQEKIDPRVLVENLRRTASQPQDEPELSLFDTFDGLEDLDLIEFYKHEANWSNRMILGDSLQVMGSLAEREDLRGQVQMVYIDPPYGIKFGSNWQASARKRDVKDGKVEDAAREAEQIKAFRDTWELGIHSYLSYLRDRLFVARDLLTESGSCFVQIGDENVHLVRSLMDEVFGPENFVSEVTFKKTGGQSSRTLANVADYILWFAKDGRAVKYRELFETKRPGQEGATQYTWIEDGDKRRSLRAGEEPSSNARLFQPYPLTSDGPASEPQPFEWREATYQPSRGSHWKVPVRGLGQVAIADRLIAQGKTLRFVNYLDDYPVTPRTNIWTDTQTSGFGADRVYVVQTLPRVVERCMLMCTDPGELVLDPTCGSGTTAFVAEQWGRRWITIDTSRVALALARQRLMGAKYPMYLLADSDNGKFKEAEVSQQPRVGGASTNDIRHGFVYERVQHITLKSIANNPDIVEGMTRDEIDAAIKKHAEFETLYDRPYQDKRAVRVAGPFTVESLSPHRSLAFAGGPDTDHESATERAGEEQPDAPQFEASILENLVKAGIQNGLRGERIELESLEPYAGQYIQAVARQKVADGDGGGEAGSPLRVGIALGPQYGTVSQRFAASAVKEAVAAQDIDLVCVLGFAFDAQAADVTEADGVTVETSRTGFAEVADERSFGRIKMLLVRMNVDLLMGEDLKKTGAGNLFTVFGEPDLEIRREGDEVVVELHGVDVYDPTTGEVRSRDTNRIALWMIDTDYNGDSFFVRHCYFTGGGDPYKRLKTALKAEIDADAWSQLYGTVSHPFAVPSTGKIAVKVINDYGDEVMKVFEVTA